MAADPYYVAAWDDPIGRLRAAEADAAHWKARALAAEAEVARIEAETYECVCGRRVDPDLEPSPGEPTRCPDCWNDLMREEAS